ncbi:MAG TPA: hypothetical protein VGK48_04620 [Terriglobia bacterium]|jgi:hypothetical protein
MLRIIVERNSKTATMRLVGKLAGPWLEELDRTWADIHSGGAGDGVLLDLSDVTFVAPEARERLESMYRQGARFKTSSCCGKSIVEEIMRSQA